MCLNDKANFNSFLSIYIILMDNDNATYHNNGCLKKYAYVQIVEDCLVDHECTTETCSNITLKMKMER